MRKFSSLFSTAVVASLFVVATSCKDDDDPKTKTDLLTGKSWSYDKAQVEVSGVFVDVPEHFEACELDNAITFTKAGVYNQTVGTDDCDGDDTDESGTWKWNSDETVVTITYADDSSDSTDIEIISLTETELKVQVGTVILGDINFDGKIDSKDAQKLYIVLKGK